MYIKIHVLADSKRENIEKESEDSYAISVSTPAERGLANKRALELLRSHLGPSKRVIKIVSGHQSPHKIVSVEDKK